MLHPTKHMTDQDIVDYDALSTNDDDEIEGLNERLLELLSAQKALSQNVETNAPRPLDDINASGDSLKVDNKALVSPLCGHCKYDCSFLHNDSPVNLPALPTYLPPIGVFWDIENCHVSIKLDAAIVQSRLLPETLYSKF